MKIENNLFKLLLLVLYLNICILTKDYYKILGI